MKKNRKKQKGFSLVELIVVIAVMAVLVVVLAPVYLRYVDKARLQKDVSAIGEVVEAVKVAAAEEAVAAEIATPSDVSTAFAEEGILSYAQVIIHGESSEGIETGTISANKMKSDVTLGDVADFIGGFIGGNPTVPREPAPNLQREVVATVGEVVKFESKNLKKLDVILTVTKDADYNITVTVNVDSFKNYEDVAEALAVFGSTGEDNSAKCAHNWVNSECTKCAEKCTSHTWKNGDCTVCDAVCKHETWSNGECDNCDVVCKHEGATYTDKTLTQHTVNCSVCETTKTEPHSFSNSVCDACSYTCVHEDDAGNDLRNYEPSIFGSHYVSCGNCNDNLDSGGTFPTEGCTFVDGVCKHCKQTCNHIGKWNTSASTSVCSGCGETCSNHNYAGSKWTGYYCTTCGKKK